MTLEDIKDEQLDPAEYLDKLFALETADAELNTYVPSREHYEWLRECGMSQGAAYQLVYGAKTGEYRKPSLNARLHQFCWLRDRDFYYNLLLEAGRLRK